MYFVNNLIYNLTRSCYLQVTILCIYLALDLKPANFFFFFFCWKFLFLITIYYLYFSTTTLLILHRYCQMKPPYKIDASNDASTSFSVFSCLFFFSDCYCSDCCDEWECSLFLLLWLPLRNFCWFEPSSLRPYDDKLYHRTTVSCLKAKYYVLSILPPKT